jgi:hypothetical protein
MNYEKHGAREYGANRHLGGRAGTRQPQSRARFDVLRSRDAALVESFDVWAEAKSEWERLQKDTGERHFIRKLYP